MALRLHKYSQYIGEVALLVMLFVLFTSNPITAPSLSFTELSGYGTFIYVLGALLAYKTIFVLIDSQYKLKISIIDIFALLFLSILVTT